MKIRDGHRRDFWAYVRHNRRVNGRCGNPSYFCPDAYDFERGDGDTLRCFVEHESTGKMKLQPREPRLLKLAFDGKKLLNFHVEQWAEGLVEGTSTLPELQLEQFPEWVKVAVLRQERKLMKRRAG